MKKNLSILSMLLLGVAAQASAADHIVDFEDVTGTNLGDYSNYGSSVTSRGFVFTSTDIAGWNSGTSFGNYTGSTAIFANYGYDTMTMTKSGGGSFTLKSIDLANVYPTNNVQGSTVNFVGMRADLSTISQSFVIAPGDNLLHTGSFSGFNDVVSVSWTQDPYYHQFDNVAVQSVPEPASMAALGLGALGILKRRKRNA